MQEYLNWLERKISTTHKSGIEIDANQLHPSTKPHQRDSILWGLGLGKALWALECGLGKSHIQIEAARMLHEHCGGCYLIVTELGVTQEFDDPEIGEGARLGVPIEYVTDSRRADELYHINGTWLFVTNYERVRMGSIDFSVFKGVFLDEGSYIKNMASETTDALHRELQKVPFRFISTATPSPNETLELINYAHILGVADRGQLLTRFFQRNSQKAGDLTLHPHHEEEFWHWVSSWALFLTEPADLGYENEGYELPPLTVNWHCLALTDTINAKADRDGQTKLMADAAKSLQDAAAIKKATIDLRLQKALEIVNNDGCWGNRHSIIWHHLEEERKKLRTEVFCDVDYADVYGSQKWEQREKNIIDFSTGNLQYLGTKPELSGVGCNFQKHCYHSVYVGINYEFEIFYQSIRRIYRFGQTKPVTIDIIYTEAEEPIRQALEKKWQLHNEQREQMRTIIRTYGLNHDELIAGKKRSFITDRKFWKGEHFTLANNDSVLEMQHLQDNSVDMILTSIPFGNHYEYTDKYNDFGHNGTDELFFQQMGFLIPELLRVLKPGRIAAVHTKDRIHYGSVTGLGFSKLERFTDKTADAFEKHGFYTIGYHYVNTDVVRENAQTYRLGHSEMCKDATKMGAGIPEKILLFRKAPTSNSDAYADEPVRKNKADYTRAQWQIDAAAMWRSNGNRHLNPDELKQLSTEQAMKWWKLYNRNELYSYEQHVQLCQALQDANRLPASFMMLSPQSHTEMIWDDVNFMHCLNAEQSRRKQQNHICPMPFDEVDRLINMYSMPGELILDPFGGVATTGVRAVKLNRKAYISELNSVYAACGLVYLKEAEAGRQMVNLFDLMEMEEM